MSPRTLVVATALFLAGCAGVGELLGIVVTDAGAGSESSTGGGADAQSVADSQLATDGSDAVGAAEGADEGVDTIRADTDAAVGDSTLGQGRFGPVSLVSAVSNAGWINEDPSLTADQLELYLASLQTGTVAIWVARRAALTDAWGAPQRVVELGSPANEPCVSRDGLTIWFGRPGARDAGTSSHIWVASRAATTAAWDPPRQVVELAATGFDDEKPSVDDTSLVMVFMSNRPGGAGGVDLYISMRASQSAHWGAPVNLTEVNTAGDDRDPFISGDALQLFWAANQPPGQIRAATRLSASAHFSAFQSLTELGQPDYDPNLSVDLRHIMFASQRAGDQHQQIYEAFR